MMRYTFYAILSILTILAIFIAYQRYTYTHIPLIPGESKSIWLIEAKIEFEPKKNKPVLVSLNIPNQVPGYSIFFEQSSSAGYGFNIVQTQKGRRAQWSTREASSKQTLFYKIQVMNDKSNIHFIDKKINTPHNIIWTEPQEIAKNDLLQKAFSLSSDDDTFTRELIKLFASNSTKESTSLLLTKPKVDVINALLQEAGVKSRVSMGLQLEDARRNQPLIPMIEIYHNEQWLLYDPNTAKQSLQNDLFLWHRGGSLIELTGGSNANVSFSMVEQKMSALELARAHHDDSAFALFSIYSLPIEEQSLFKMLLLLPMGALVTVLIRLLIGIRTSGTFMPVLIAMAFLQTTLLPGLITFIMIVAIGLMLRSYLSYLNLLLVSRIASTIIIVIFIIVAASLLGHNLGFHTGLTVAVFPIIILAWTIERMSILWEEDGAKEVLIQGFGSLFVATLAYLVMQSDLAEHLSFNYPELNLIVLAVIMLMGRYTGYRLSELYRFREFKVK